MVSYYNDNDAKSVEWLRSLIAAGLLPDGVVDDQSIREVSDGLDAYDQCHFFAGIGGWPLALQLAGWPQDVPVWTGSCPCQPFSNAGKRKGVDDERHLWPEFHRLIDQWRPPVVFGEQVASKAGREWYGGTGLQRMRDREAVKRVLQGKNLQGRLSNQVQGVLSTAGTEEEAVCPRCGTIQKTQGDTRNCRCNSCGEVFEVREISTWFGEGFEEKDGREWLSGVRDDLEALGYVVGAADLCVSGTGPEAEGWIVRGDSAAWEPIVLGPPHIRQRLYWVAYMPGFRRSLHSGSVDGLGNSDSLGESSQRRVSQGPRVKCPGSTGRVGYASREGLQERISDTRVQREEGRTSQGQTSELSGIVSWVADSRHGVGGREGQQRPNGEGAAEWNEETDHTKRCCGDGRVACADGRHTSTERLQCGREYGQQSQDSVVGPWSNFDIVHCSDGKARRIESGTFPLAYGIPGRVAQLRGLGNAIVPQTAAEFVGAFMSAVVDVEK